MQDVHHGASHDADARLKGEILSSLSAWTADYELERLDLAWTVAQMLLKHVQREQTLDVYLEFAEKLVAILSDEARDIRAVVGEAVRRHAH
ncbi:hypothetical protein [Ancylobacter lacus]|uniref:hypothetical protein n=1 Tax=Ancylobacter lacus TaxID=2579970 RepID=UPI001BCCDA50|nr:hypothetical protein [Ancylobacter lacus]MBS7537743.1 hypothetical protein [Ancylobacter lacus]